MRRGILASLIGFEPTAFRFGGERSVQLGYSDLKVPCDYTTRDFKSKGRKTIKFGIKFCFSAFFDLK